MFELFGGQTPNVFKPLIMLEEIGASYRRVPVDISRGEQFTPEFLAISPNNRVPALVDHAPADGGAPLSVFESGAILVYLAEKADAFLPAAPRPRAMVLQWLMWQMGGQGPMVGQAGHFRNYAPEKIPYGIERYTNEARRLYGVLDKRLTDREFIADAYSIADMACWPWIVFRAHHGMDLAEFPAIERWFNAIDQRPAVRRALGDFVAADPKPFTDEERAILFGIKK